MQGVFRAVLLLTIILSACSAIPATSQPDLPATTEPLSLRPTTAVPSPKPIQTVGTPHIDQRPAGSIPSVPPNPQNCGYQWGYQDLPELSNSFQQSIQILQPEAQANAYIFGENCILSDGSVGGFLARETDFNVALQVSDLSNESELGMWIVKVMQVVTEIPPEQIVGPVPGRVSLTFQSNPDQKVINFYINQYQDLPSGLSPSEIFQALQIPQ